MSCPKTVNLADANIQSDELLPVQVFLAGVQVQDEYERTVTFWWVVEADAAKGLIESLATSIATNPIIGGKTYEGTFRNSAVRANYEGNGTAKITQSMSSTFEINIVIG